MICHHRPDSQHRCSPHDDHVTVVGSAVQRRGSPSRCRGDAYAERQQQLHQFAVAADRRPEQGRAIAVLLGVQRVWSPRAVK